MPGLWKSPRAKRGRFGKRVLRELSGNLHLVRLYITRPLENQTEKIMRKRTSKKQRVAGERFQRAVTDYLTSIGATPSEFYAFQIETKAGMLRVTPYEDWIATRFDDPARAKSVLGDEVRWLNPHSGKWNFHFHDDDISTFALTYFTQCLEPILP